jgi:hypothetical protein
MLTIEIAPHLVITGLSQNNSSVDSAAKHRLLSPNLIRPFGGQL